MPCSAFPTPKCMTTTRLIWKLRKFAIRWILQTKCVGVWVKFHNLGILLLTWYRKRFFNHNWRPSWILTSLMIRKEILTNCIAFVIHKNIYLAVNFVYFWYLEAEIRKFHFLACFSGFSGGATFRHKFDHISKTVPYINLVWMQIVRE